MGGLDLTSFESMMRGGASGPAVTPKDPDKSSIIKKQAAGGHAGQLTPEELELEALEISRPTLYELMDKYYGYVRLSQFQEKTDSDFEKAVRALEAESKGTLKGRYPRSSEQPGGPPRSGGQNLQAGCRESILRSG
jgi:hypothetical protein